MNRSLTVTKSLAPGLNTKRLDILKDTVPKLARVDFFTGREALALKVKFEEIETQTDPNGLGSAFQSAKNKQVNAIMTTAARPFFT